MTEALLTQAGERFARDIADHVMTVRLDDGLYRHLRFAMPGRSTYWFSVVTWPGVLTIDGDMGTYVFSRVEDMFEFFRGGGIDPHYWAEKLRAGNDVQAYSEQRFRQHVEMVISDLLADGADRAGEEASLPASTKVSLPGATYRDLLTSKPSNAGNKALIDAIRAEVLGSGDTYHEEGARAVLDSFQYGSFTFSDTWEWDLRDYTGRFLWNCHAIKWAIAQYDARPVEAALPKEV